MHRIRSQSFQVAKLKIMHIELKRLKYPVVILATLLVPTKPTIHLEISICS
jgi:hypothetical protein